MSKIIVVDDDHTNITLTKMLLELDGFQVTTCTDIPQATEAAGNGIDAFVIDYHLARGVNGLELLHQIRNGETAAAPETIVIVTSGDYRREIESNQAGADLFLHKPYPPENLSEELKKLLKMRESHGK
ncbi:MAG: response regulator [Anaerolineae bacterium]